MPRAVRAPRALLAAAAFLLALAAQARAGEFPPLTGNVVDMGGALSADTKAGIETWTADFQALGQW